METNAFDSKNTTVTPDKVGSVVETKDTALNNVAVVGLMDTAVAAVMAGLAVEVADTVLTDCTAIDSMDTTVVGDMIAGLVVETMKSNAEAVDPNIAAVMAGLSGEANDAFVAVETKDTSDAADIAGSVIEMENTAGGTHVSMTTTNSMMHPLSSVVINNNNIAADIAGLSTELKHAANPKVPAKQLHIL